MHVFAGGEVHCEFEIQPAVHLFVAVLQLGFDAGQFAFVLHSITKTCIEAEAAPATFTYSVHVPFCVPLSITPLGEGEHAP